MGERTGNAKRLLNLGYGPAVARGRLVDLERYARRNGLDLETLELLGQNPAVVEAFLHAAADGRARAFVEALDFGSLRLERKMRAQGISVVAQRVMATS